MESRPHSSAGNKNKWAPSSSVVESRNKARELSRALERAATDLKAIDRQFQLLDSGLLSEEELKKFAGKSFFQKNTTPKRFQYLDAAETRQKRMNHEEHVVQKQLAARQRNKGVASSSPSRSNPSSPVRRQHLHSKSPVRLNKIEHSSNRPISPYAISKTNTNTNTTKSSSPSSSSFPPSSRGSSVALSNIRDERVEETFRSKSHSTRSLRRNRNGAHVNGPVNGPAFDQPSTAVELEILKRNRRNMKKEDKLSQSTRQSEYKITRKLDQQLFVFYAARFGPLDGVLYAQASMPGVLYEKIITDASLSVQQWLVNQKSDAGAM